MRLRVLNTALCTVLLGVGATVGAIALSSTTAGAVPTPDFTVCPGVGQAPQCNVVIVINPSGSPTIAVNPNGEPPYDGGDDTLIGVQNLSGQTINTLPISGTPDAEGQNIFDLDGDGGCSAAFLNCHNAADPTGYAGPTTFFTNIDESHSSGTVNFVGGLAPGASTWFSLETVVTGSSLVVHPPITGIPVSVTTTPSFSGVVATFTDPDTSEIAAGFSASINWGDGTPASPGVIGGTPGNFTVSGTHAFASTGTKDVVVTITETDSPDNQAVVHSTFIVVPACTTGQVCTESVPGVQSTTVVAASAAVSLSLGPDPSFTCNDTFQHTPLVMTFSSTGGAKLPKLVVATIDKSQVGSHKPADFHICYGAGEAFKDLNGHAVPAGGNGLLPFCVDLAAKKLNPPPCELPTVQLKGSIVESFLAPGNDPKAH